MMKKKVQILVCFWLFGSWFGLGFWFGWYGYVYIRRERMMMLMIRSDRLREFALVGSVD